MRVLGLGRTGQPGRKARLRVVVDQGHTRGVHETKITLGSPDTLENEADLPPVVARLVVEIRSDGTRTIARGAMEDAQMGQKVSVKAEGTTPLELAFGLMKSLAQLPALGLAKSFHQVPAISRTMKALFPPRARNK